MTPAERRAFDGVRFDVSIRIDAAEFGAWQPDQIAALFEGIAQVLEAGEPPKEETSRD